MTDTARRARNAQALAECHPVFARRVGRLLAAMEAEGWRPRIQQAWRSPAEQLARYTAGLSQVRWSFHNAINLATGRPEALAVDIVDEEDVADDGQLNLSRGLGFVFALAALAEPLALATGITFGLPRALREGLWAAIRARDLRWPRARIGWDPGHVEPQDVTLALAKRGVRPLDLPEDAGPTNFS
jgi:hypothetical protein